MGLGRVVQKSLKQCCTFSNQIEKNIHFQTAPPGARAWVDRGQGPGPRPQPGRVFFQTQFENGPFFQNSLKKVSPFQFF